MPAHVATQAGTCFFVLFRSCNASFPFCSPGPGSYARNLARRREPSPPTLAGHPGRSRQDRFRAGNVPDGTAFFVGEEEVGHLHRNNLAHVATSPALRQVLVARGLARPLPWGGDAFPGWTEVSVRTAADVMHAAWLLELSYHLLQGHPEARLIERINEYQAGVA